jgi:hypothetical protein
MSPPNSHDVSGGVDEPPQAPEQWAVPWPTVDRLLARLDVEATCEQRLGPLAAYRRRMLGQEVPEQLRREERAAATANLVAPALLARARDAYDGTLVVLKGPELASRYPGRARRFADLDLLAADAEEAQAALLAAGFQLQDRDAAAARGLNATPGWPPPGYDEERNPHYHMHPLEWPGLGLRIEVHKQVRWPPGLTAPRPAEIFEAATPGSLGIEGLLVPDPSHHAVLMSAHAWGEVAMRHIRELMDVFVFVDVAGRDAPARLAERWGFRRGWETTLSVADWLLLEEPEPVAVKLWARYLRGLREPTVIEMHVQEWLAPFWMAPPRAAARCTVAALARDVLPAPEQTWAEKARQIVRALLHPFSPRTEHDRRSGIGRKTGRAQDHQ